MPIDQRWNTLTGADWDAFALAWLAELRGDSIDDSGMRQRVVMMNFTSAAEHQWSYINAAIRHANTDDELVGLGNGAFFACCGKRTMNNSLFVIKPFKWNGMWVFDDDRVGLEKEPFVAGADTMIDTAVQWKGIQNAEDGFLWCFPQARSPTPISTSTGWGRTAAAMCTRADSRSITEVQEMEGWLCPALNLYYPEAPKKLYVQIREAK
jgi:hypothetical protein